MKRHLLTSFLLVAFALSAKAQTTATDFNITDCGGINRHLFATLDSGKVVVMAFVHPCGSCIGPSVSANNVVKSFASTHPDRVHFYIVDDNADNSCSTIGSWASNNGMAGSIVIFDPAVVQTQYGSPAMPKIVAVAGWNRKIWFKQDNGLNSTNLKNAINNALVATGTEPVGENQLNVSVYPNPSSGTISVRYSLKENSEISISVINTLGAEVFTTETKSQINGEHNQDLDLSVLSNGIYFIRVSTGESVQTVKFSLAR